MNLVNAAGCDQHDAPIDKEEMAEADYEVGGVTNRLCSSCVLSREDAVADGSSPATVHTPLGEALGSTLPGVLCVLASEGEANTFRGILD